MTAKIKKPLWMPLYINEYLGDTMHLSAEQHGAYLLLLMAAFKSGGGVPNDPIQLAATARLSSDEWAKHQPILAPYFTVSAERWTHHRVVSELQRASELIAKKSAAGRIGAAAKWGISDE